MDVDEQQAEYLASLVQGSQALEGAALIEEGRRKLVEKCKQLLKEKRRANSQEKP